MWTHNLRSRATRFMSWAGGYSRCKHQRLSQLTLFRRSSTTTARKNVESEMFNSEEADEIEKIGKARRKQEAVYHNRKHCYSRLVITLLSHHPFAHVARVLCDHTFFVLLPFSLRNIRKWCRNTLARRKSTVLRGSTCCYELPQPFRESRYLSQIQASPSGGQTPIQGNEQSARSLCR